MKTAAAVALLLLAQVTPTVCVPEGLPPFKTWVTVETQVDSMDDESGAPLLVAKRRHRLPGGQVVTTWWRGDALVMVQDDPALPPLIDIGAVTRSQKLIAPVAVCEYVRAREKRP